MTETTHDVQTIKAHLAINVRDVKASVEFYKRMFGIEPSKVRTGYAKFDIQNPPLNFTLNERPFSDAGALSHLGIQVAATEDVLKVRARWAEAGLYTRDEMGTNCCYATQDKTWVRDPDGNAWEVFVVLKDNLPEASSQISTCCAPTLPAEIKREPSAANATMSRCAPATSGAKSLKESSQPFNVCNVFTDEASGEMVVQLC